VAGVKVATLLPRISREHTVAFVTDWFSDVEGWVVISRISSAGKHILRSWALPVPQLLKVAQADDLALMCSDDGGTWNVYVSCSTHVRDPTEGGKRRGGKSTLTGIHGTWLDLDVKDESFSSGQEIDEFISQLPITPSLVIGSGSGGRHVYWRYAEGSLPLADGERVAEAWWALAQELAGERWLDNVTTGDRIMRLPGTVRWPKEQGEPVGSVEVLFRGRPVQVDRIWQAGRGAWEQLESRRRSTRDTWRRHDEAAGLEIADLARSSGWLQLWALAHVEQIFNENSTWDEILIPTGWTYVCSDHEGRRHWSRPGKHGKKSGDTDYPPSPHVMKLFSKSPDTGLAELADAGVPLTKFRVYAQLAYGGDTAELTRAIVDSALQKERSWRQGSGQRAEGAEGAG
jgi:hypothetical protein